MSHGYVYFSESGNSALKTSMKGRGAVVEGGLEAFETCISTAWLVIACLKMRRFLLDNFQSVRSVNLLEYVPLGNCTVFSFLRFLYEQGSIIDARV
jgi:hypothetical protein